MPFQQMVDTYFEIVPTPLVPVMFDGGVLQIIRGPPQEIQFDPTAHSRDPDFPDDKV